MRELNCSSKGDRRFSALTARVDVCGSVKPIELHYQLSKRFPWAPKQWKQAKGRKPTHFEVARIEFPTRLLSAWYTLLWVKYLDNRPELVAYARRFDRFVDPFAGAGCNSQADVIECYVKRGREQIMQRSDVREFCELWDCKNAT